MVKFNKLGYYTQNIDDLPLSKRVFYKEALVCKEEEIAEWKKYEETHI